MIDAVLSYHTNPATCGVAKFNQRLARELGVPCLPFEAAWPECGSTLQKPLISVKYSELFDDNSGRIGWHEWYDATFDRRFALFLHDTPDNTATCRDIVKRADEVYAANATVATAVRSRFKRPDVIDAWCPSTIEGNPHRGTINVLTFGMAHKIQTLRYEKLKTLLDATGEDYTVSVSTAIHEGSPWDETALVADRLRHVFGGRVRVLGYLADDALARELLECTAVALFFDPALRANNTTFWAAVDAQKPVITNTDAESPEAVCYDIDELDSWPMRLGIAAGIYRYDWNRLTDMIQGQPCVK